MRNWREAKDRILTNYPGAAVTIEGDGIKVTFLGETYSAGARGDGRVVVSRHKKDATTVLYVVDTLDDAFGLLVDGLGEEWRAAQRPKSSPGGPSSPGRGDEEGVAAVGDYCEGAGESDDDGGDE